jgi:hypothetical protein
LRPNLHERHENRPTQPRRGTATSEKAFGVLFSFLSLSIAGQGLRERLKMGVDVRQAGCCVEFLLELTGSQLNTILASPPEKMFVKLSEYTSLWRQGAVKAPQPKSSEMLNEKSLLLLFSILSEVRAFAFQF